MDDGLVTAGAMRGGQPAGVAFPAVADGRRSTSALGRAVVADALSPVDPAAARAAERETNWRTGYPAHFRGLIEAGLASKQAAVSVAREGLESLHRRMRVIGRCSDSRPSRATDTAACFEASPASMSPRKCAG